MTSHRLASALRLSPLVLAALLAAATAGAEPLSGRYQARPSPVVGCGGFSGECRVFQLEGWVEVETFGIVFPGSLPAVRFLASDLRLRSVGDDTSFPFPAPGDLELAQLVVVNGAQHIVDFANPPGAQQTVELNLLGVEDPEQSGETHFLLSGFYDEGCCDRFRYEIGGVLFDWTGPLAQPPALFLDHGFRVTVTWRAGRGGSGVGTPIAFDGASGRFWFFQPDNPELLVKVIDACEEPFGRFWFFAAGLTDVEVEIRVEGPAIFEDEKVYTSPAGTPFASILDTEGFDCGQDVV
jgi:hypothetical protein